MKILVAMGTRPEIVKLAPVVKALSESRHQLVTVATGQHYDDAMAGGFFSDLDVEPDVRWNLPAGEAERLGVMFEKALDVVGSEKPDIVVCLGDTYTVPLFCLASRRFCVPVAHLEAGLRSLNETSMEEVNRRVAAATASLHLAPTSLAARMLEREGIKPERVRVVGNPVLDVLRQRAVTPRALSQRCGVTVTAHRPSNVDDPHRRARLVELLLALSTILAPVRFPAHPRTRKLLDADGALPRLASAGVQVLDPLRYPEMLEALASSQVVLTDSGGLQEEASWLGVPVVVLRKSTPRWEGVQAGTSVLVGMDPDAAIAAATRFASPSEQLRVASQPCPYGDGHTSEAVVSIFAEEDLLERLSFHEPDYTQRLPVL
jgi:UDP-N-acetylglucosamine 2-epimerase (non-hydrolysing)